MVVCQPPPVGSGEHYFLMKYGGKVSASLGCIRSLYSTNLANYATLPHKKHNNTQQPTRAGATLPTSGFLGPLSPWQHPPWTYILAPPIPMGLKLAQGVRCALAIAGSVNWSVEIGRTIK